jgi:ribosome recycling factor
MEECRVEIRQLRREAADDIRGEERDGDIGADEAHRGMEKLQQLHDRWIAEVDRVGAVKEQEILEV